jgi:hypothetical protein
MAKTKPQLSTTLLLLLFLLLTITITTTAFSFSRSYSQYKTLFSLSHYLLTRVSNLRASRGDISGSNRAKLIAQKFDRGLGFGFWGLSWSVGWDYAYKNVLRVAQSVLRRLVKVFRQSVRNSNICNVISNILYSYVFNICLFFIILLLFYGFICYFVFYSFGWCGGRDH